MLIKIANDKFKLYFRDFFASLILLIFCSAFFPTTAGAITANTFQMINAQYLIDTNNALIAIQRAKLAATDPSKLDTIAKYRALIDQEMQIIATQNTLLLLLKGETPPVTAPITLPPPTTPITSPPLASVTLPPSITPSSIPTIPVTTTPSTAPATTTPTATAPVTTTPSTAPTTATPTATVPVTTTPSTAPATATPTSTAPGTTTPSSSPSTPTTSTTPAPTSTTLVTTTSSTIPLTTQSSTTTAPSIPSTTQSATTTAPPPPPPTAALQNATSYNFVLSHISLLNATCTPPCVVSSRLAPNALQTYSFSAGSGFITFDYDVLNDTKRIGHLTIQAKPGTVTLLNGLGGVITQSTLYSKIEYIPPVPYWKSQFTDLAHWESNNWNVSKSLSKWGLQNIEVKASVAGAAAPKNDNYIRIHYPKGSANYQSGPPIGGAQFYGAMIDTDAPVTLSFYILFPTDFPFIGGERGLTVGKLPGLYGGLGNTGTNIPTGTDGWSLRYMWCDYSEELKKKFVAGGELLQFTVNSNLGPLGTKYGVFLGCGNWTFVPDGKWHNLQQTVHMNEIGKANGRIDICYDGVLVLSQQNVMFRTVDTLKTNGILFQTFFGGGDSSYATPIDTYADFADFELYLYPPSAPPGLCITNQ